MPEVVPETGEDDFDDRLLFCDSGPTQERQAERARLQRKVIEAAKAYRLAVREHMEYAKECMGHDRADDEDEDPKWDAQLGAQCTTEHALSIAVDALIDFESKQ